MREIKIDFDNPGLPQRLDVVENDAQSRFFKAVLYKDGKAYAAPSGATYSIMYRGFGPQNEGWYDTINDGAGKRAACSVSGNVVTCEIARQALRVPGHVSVVLCVTGSNGYMLHGWPIDCNCRNDNYTGGTSVESFFYITQVTNADWTAAIKTWEELKNMIDPTLSLSGKAADAKATGDAVGELKEDVENEYKTAEDSFLFDTIHLFIPHSQGRWIETESGQIEKETGASENVTSIRVRSDVIISYPYPVTVQAMDGFLFSLYYVDAGGKKVGETNWDTAWTIPQAVNFAITIKKSDGGALDNLNFNDYVKITMCNPDFYDFVYGTGGYTYQSFNKPVKLNQTDIAVPIRKHIPFAIDRPFRCTVPSGYIVNVVCLLPNGNFGGAVEYSGEKIFDVYCKNALVSIRKEDDSDISFSDCNNVKIEYIDGFIFEGGSTDTSSGKWVANDSVDALSIRLRTPVMSIGKTCEIICKEGYSIFVDEFLHDGTFVKEPYNASYFRWVKRCVLQGGKYYSIVIKKDDKGSLFASQVSDYIIHDFETYKFCTQRMKEYNVLYIGDSITENNYTAVSNWTKRVTGAFDFANTDNVAMGGTGIIAGGKNGWLQRLDSFPEKNYDLILVMGNMNDYSNNIFNANNLGQFGDSETATEYGAVNTFIKRLCDKYPNSKIGWIVSTPRQYYAGDSDNPDPVTENGYLYGVNSPFYNAGKAIEKVCANYSIPVLNLFEHSNFKCWLKTTKDQYFYNDGNMVHPNDEGNKLISIKIMDFLSRNF